MVSACKFHPTCSRYAAESIRMHGARKGAWLALRRLGRCHPFTRGGFDPVPEIRQEAPMRRGREGNLRSPARRFSGSAIAYRHYRFVVFL
jgi:putative membrane protein insertion efficiency factor